MRKVLLPAALLGLVVGCSDSSTEPKADVSGHWTYSATNVAGGGLSCNIAGVNLTLAQTGTTVTGTVASGTVSCSGVSGAFTDSLGDDVIANGQIIGNAIQFDIGTSDVHNAGSLNGNSMSGVLTLRAESGTTTVLLTGNFTAVR